MSDKNLTNAFSGVPVANANALKKFEALGWPTRKTESWKYTSVKAVQESEYALAAGDFTARKFNKGTNLVFVNGVFSADQSDALPEGVTLSFEDKASAEAEGDALYHLNTGLTSQVANIVVAKGVVVDAPLNLIFEYQATGNVCSFPRVQLAVEENAQVNLVEMFRAKGSEKTFLNGVTEITVQANAVVNHDQMHDVSASVFAVQATRAATHRSSVYKHCHFTLGEAVVRCNLDVNVLGEGARTELYALYPVKSGGHVDHNTYVNHTLPHCETHQVYKSVIQEGGRGVFSGLMQVQQAAQKTDASQLNKNLLLGAKAEADSKPQLLIHADDVKCAHGSTVGQMEQEEIFYLQSRGIPRDQAVHILVNGYAWDVVQHVSSEELRNEIAKIVEERFFDGLDL